MSFPIFDNFLFFLKKNFMNFENWKIDFISTC